MGNINLFLTCAIIAFPWGFVLNFISIKAQAIGLGVQIIGLILLVVVYFD